MVMIMTLGDVTDWLLKQMVMGDINKIIERDNIEPHSETF